MPSTIPATILVLEENAALQELIDQALRESGHRVLSTKNALEALEVVRRVRIDVLVAGVLLEERREALVGELRSIQPELRIVSICSPDAAGSTPACSRPKDLGRAREAFARKQKGASHTELEVSAARRDGTRVRVAVNSVPLRNADGAMIGSFGLVQALGEIEPSLERAPLLSARERETLTLLAAGYSTAQMAQQMNISKETVRNHVKGMFRSLGARSRVEAVAKGRRVGLI